MTNSLPIWLTENSKVRVQFQDEPKSRVLTVAHRGAWIATCLGPRGGEVLLVVNQLGGEVFGIAGGTRELGRVASMEAL